MTLFSIAIVLFLIMDPIGNISSYLKLMEGIPLPRQRIILLREMLIALLSMVLFNYLGEVIFTLLQISEPTVRLASGTILFLISLQILFPTLNAIRANLPKAEPFIIPLAIPLIAGPSVLATIMLFAHMEASQSVMLIAILIAWFAALIILLSSRFLLRILGTNGLMACERLMGMILVMIAIQRFLDGVEQFVSTFQ